MNQQTADNLPLAVAVIVFTVFALSLGDALIKFTDGDFVLWQIFVLRSLLVLPVLLCLLWLRDPLALKSPSNLGWTALRSLLLVVMWIAYYVALPNLAFSTAAAAFYTLPIFITLFSAVFIGSKIGPLGWGAVGIGFLGVLLILQPRAGDFNLYALLPLLSAILYALAMILTRTKCHAVHPLMLAFGLNAGFVISGGIAALAIAAIAPEPREGILLAPWTKMQSAEWLTMCLLAVSILIGSLGASYAYQKGHPSIIGTFDFAYVGFAVIWGLVFFAEIPDALSVLGISLIVIAGIMSVRQ